MVVLFGGVSGVVNTVSPLRAAQFGVRPAVALEAGPLERVAVRPTLDMPAPRRTLHVAPNWPPDVAVAVQYRVHLVLDATGQVAEARVLTGAVAAARDAAVAAEIDAVLAAVRQWKFDPPAQAPMLIAVDIAAHQDGATLSTREYASVRHCAQAVRLRHRARSTTSRSSIHRRHRMPGSRAS